MHSLNLVSFNRCRDLQVQGERCKIGTLLAVPVVGFFRFFFFFLCKDGHRKLRRENIFKYAYIHV